MYFLTHLVLLLYLSLEAKGDDIDKELNMTVNEIANNLVSLIGADKGNERIKDLEEKIAKINSFVMDDDKYEEMLINATKKTDLNETNFFEALSENDHFRFLTVNDSKNLYLKLKEKVNRDDIIKMIIERGVENRMVKSARKMMDGDYFGGDELDPLHEVVDKIIAEKPKNEHNPDLKNNQSIYWDPQRELEELNEYHKHDGRRIYKGERTTVRYYPFMVSVHVMGRFWCGGVVYWHDLVLTSASCLQLMHNNRFYRENPRVVQVRVGSNHSRLSGELVDALEVFFYPGYQPRTLKNNIAVIRLRRHLFFTYHRIPKAIAISHSKHSIPPTAEVLLLGWGVTRLSQKLSYEPIFLQRKFLPVYPNTFCKEVYGDKFITDTMFCAGTLTTGEGACDHDAGGPAILAGRLVGIISFGPTICGYPNAPTVFTLVGAFSDWIENVNSSMPSYYRGLKRTTTTTEAPLYEYFQTLEFTTERSTHLNPVVSTVTTVATSTPGVTTNTAGSPTTEGEATETPHHILRLKEDSSWSIDID